MHVTAVPPCTCTWPNVQALQTAHSLHASSTFLMQLRHTGGGAHALRQPGAGCWTSWRQPGMGAPWYLMSIHMSSKADRTTVCAHCRAAGVREGHAEPGHKKGALSVPPGDGGHATCRCRRTDAARPEGRPRQVMRGGAASYRCMLFWDLAQQWLVCACLRVAGWRQKPSLQGGCCS